MNVGAILYCDDDERQSWWLITDAAGEAVMLKRAGRGWSPSFDGEWPKTHWDQLSMDEQNANYVPLDRVPAAILARAAEWNLIHG